ncbi:MAG: DUF2207 domain-containing protein [Ruminococcaceae bacterium]|nr:DUF2207 domain-containing protein [Oscillospiraceae bacterium]
MKRFLIIPILLLCILLIPMQASAAEGETSLQLQAVVNTDGKCQVTIQATVHKEDAGPLYFSLPGDAASVKVNGETVQTTAAGKFKQIALSPILGSGAGDYSFSVSYTLRDVIYKTGNGLELRLPLLCSSTYRVDYLRFSLTLPGQVSAKPTFQSGYHQSNIEKDIVYAINGATITGSSAIALIDHETLSLFLAVDEAMFPQPILEIFSSDIDTFGVAVCAVLAFLYWLWKLRCLPPGLKSSPFPPEGLNAGQLGTVLGLQNANLSMMVFSWAQLGYIRIRPERERVILLKRMEMGNERSDFEQRCFKSLFAKGDRVDCSGYRYALQCQKIAHLQPPIHHLMDKRCGNRRVFQFLTTLCGLFAGLGTGLAIGFGGFWQPVTAILGAALGCYTAYHIQNWAGCLFLHKRHQLVLSISLAVIWIVLSFAAGRFLLGVLFIVLEFLAGILAYYGGRRTEDGRQAMAQILGFRRYLKRVSHTSLEALCRKNPDYFFDLAPYALALGVGKVFSRQFGPKPFRECPYIDYPVSEGRTAVKWNKIMEDILVKMDEQSQKLPLREFSKKIRRFTR